MFRRLWNFGKRHRKKLFFSAACAGGAYFAWRVWLPRLQQRLLQRLLKEDDLKELLELARGEGNQEKREQEARASFEHKQQVSDDYVRKALAELQPRHQACFSVEEIFERVKVAETREAKVTGFQELQAECLARLVSALYTLHALLLLHRVEFNIAGRELAGGEEALALEAFLGTTRHFQECSLGRVAEAARAAVSRGLEAAQLAPTAAVDLPRLESMLLQAAETAARELPGEQAAAALLPEAADAALPEAQRPRVQPLLDEARDYLESPQFQQVFKAVLAKAVQRLVQGLGDGAADPAAAPLASGRSCPLAKLNGQFIVLSKSLLSDEGNDFIAHFAEEPVVSELCEVLFFQESAGSAGAGR